MKIFWSDARFPTSPRATLIYFHCQSRSVCLGLSFHAAPFSVSPSNTCHTRWIRNYPGSYDGRRISFRISANKAVNVALMFQKQWSHTFLPLLIFSFTVFNLQIRDFRSRIFEESRINRRIGVISREISIRLSNRCFEHSEGKNEHRDHPIISLIKRSNAW